MAFSTFFPRASIHAVASGIQPLHVRFTEEFLALLQHAKITDLEPVKLRMAENVKAHNQEETPRFAVDIEKKALAGVWG